MMFSNTPKKVVFFKKTTGKVNSAGKVKLDPFNKFDPHLIKLDP
jgi:hypothetical protein